MTICSLFIPSGRKIIDGELSAIATFDQRVNHHKQGKHHVSVIKTKARQTWLVVLIILKHISSSMGRIIPYMREHRKCLKPPIRNTVNCNLWNHADRPTTQTDRLRGSFPIEFGLPKRFWLTVYFDCLHSLSAIVLFGQHVFHQQFKKS